MHRFGGIPDQGKLKPVALGLHVIHSVPIPLTQAEIGVAEKREQKPQVLMEMERTPMRKHSAVLGKVLGSCLLTCFIAQGLALAAEPPSSFRGEIMTPSSQGQSGSPSSSLLPFREPFAEGEGYRLLLDGSPQTAGIRSGRVVLQPGESAKKHTTGQHEEVLVILEGKGELWFQDFPPLVAEKGYLLYVPPQAVHDVRNTGGAELRYLYIVAPVAER